MANGARHRVYGSRSRKVTLPSDFLTPAQRRRVNSAVKTFTMNIPHTVKQLRKWPKDLQLQYMQNIISSMNPSNKDLSYVLGVSISAVCNYKRSLGLTDANRARTQTCEQVQDWKKFLRGALVDDVLAKEREAEAETDTGTDTELVDTSVAPLVADDEPGIIIDDKPVTYSEITMSFSGSIRDLVRLLISGPVTLSVDDTYDFALTCKRKEAV